MKLKIFAIALLALFFFQPVSRADNSVCQIPVMLERVHGRIIKNFKAIDLYINSASSKLAGNNASPFTLDPTLSFISTSAPYIVDAAFIDTNGIIRDIQPPYAGAVGTDISNQEQVMRVMNTKEPVVSKLFLSVEGFYAVSFQHPILNGDQMLGSVSVLVRPQTMFNDIIEHEIQGVPVDMWIMQDDGTIVYDKDTEEIGRNLFTDDLYKPFPQLLSVGKMIASETNGCATYEFYAKGTRTVRLKSAYWTTINVYGTVWKVVMTASNDNSSPDRTLSDIGEMSMDEGLKALSVDPDFIKACDNKDTAAINTLLKNYYKAYPCYSAQWADAGHMNVTGFPARNSLIGYRFDTNKDKRDEDFIQYIDAKHDVKFDAPLFEGNTGSFHLVPVFNGDKYLGMVYYIWVKP